MFVRNHWYATAWTSELGESVLPRQIVGESIMLFRGPDGTPAALLDRCPHRFAPLSMGENRDGVLQCGYHGLEFDGSGTCVNVPGQDRIPPAACVRSFPVAERFGLLFVWMGDADLADESKLFEIDRVGKPGWNTMLDGYQLHQTGYLNVVENLLDPAHTTFLHKMTIANPAAAEVPVQIERTDDHVVAYRWIENSRPSPNDRRSHDFAEDAVVDRAQYFYCYPPSVSRVDICVMDAGQPHTDEYMDQGMRTLSYKFVTPETEGTTHIFWMHVRNYRLDEPEFEESLRSGLEKTFWEDNDMCGALQKWQDTTGRRQDVSLAIDRAPRMATQMIEAMIDAESQTAT